MDKQTKAYDVAIIETFVKVVTVEAQDHTEAAREVRIQWDSGNHELTEDDFRRVDFAARKHGTFRWDAKEVSSEYYQFLSEWIESVGGSEIYGATPPSFGEWYRDEYQEDLDE